MGVDLSVSNLQRETATCNPTPFRDDIALIEGDVRSYHIVRQAVAGVDVILHQTALPSVLRSTGDPLTTSEVNVTGSLHLLEAAREAGVRRVVQASSSSVYGNGPERPKPERMAPTPPAMWNLQPVT